uniref:Uncharacterized protein n=1 Tax=Anguilla anguilla TaxID=7936 RepID=A0A0E9W818_ANGAN
MMKDRLTPGKLITSLWRFNNFLWMNKSKKSILIHSVLCPQFHHRKHRPGSSNRIIP